MPSLTTSSLHRIGLALQRLAVNTVAESCCGPLLTTRATSLPPLDFSPAGTPAAVKPAGWVTLMHVLLGGWRQSGTTRMRLPTRCADVCARFARSLLDLL